MLHDFWWGFGISTERYIPIIIAIMTLQTVEITTLQWESLDKGQVEDGSFVPYTVESLYKGQVRDGSFIPYTMEPLYKGQVGDGSFVPYTVEPLYKGQVGDGSFVPYTVEPLYKGQVGVSLTQWSLSTRDKLRMGHLSLTQWSLSTRDKLRMGPLSLTQWSLSTRDKLRMGPLSLVGRLSLFSKVTKVMWTRVDLCVSSPDTKTFMHNSVISRHSIQQNSDDMLLCYWVVLCQLITETSQTNKHWRMFLLCTCGLAKSEGGIGELLLIVTTRQMSIFHNSHVCFLKQSMSQGQLWI